MLSFCAGSQEIVAASSLSTYLQHFLLLAGEQKELSEGLVFYLKKFDLPSRGNCCSYAVGSAWEWGKVTSGAQGLGFFLTHLESLD